MEENMKDLRERMQIHYHHEESVDIVKWVGSAENLLEF